MKLLKTLFICLCIPLVGYGQSAQGLLYQGVATDITGKPISEKIVNLQLSLFSLEGEERSTFYVETHKAKTNAIGGFKLIIGEGNSVEGHYAQVPWSSYDIWISTALDLKGQGQYEEIQSTKLLAVPYAIHAQTAVSLNDNLSNSRNSFRSSFWSIDGNKETRSSLNFLGTRNNEDLVIKTNDRERMRVLSDGTVSIFNANIGELESDNTLVENQLTVGDNGLLNVLGLSNFNGESDFNGPLNAKSTLTVGGLFMTRNDAYFYKDVEMRLDLSIGNNLLVHGESDFDGLVRMHNGVDISGVTSLEELEVSGNSTLGGDLNLSGDATMEKTLNVTGNTNLNARLTVEDDAYIKSILAVDGQTVIKNILTVQSDVPDGEYLASFENSNSGDGDGIKIKLGKARPVEPSDDIPIFLGPLKNATDNVDTIINNLVHNKVPNLIDVYIDFINPKKVLDNNLLFTAGLCNMAQSIGNSVISEINDGLDLPFTDRKLLVALNGYDPAITDPDCSCLPTGSCTDFDCWIKDSWIEDLSPSVWIPEIPEVSICNEIFPGFTLPKFPDLKVNPNSLSQKNNFIFFADKDDKRVGAITGVSRNEYLNDVFDEFYVINVAAELVGLDPLQMIVQGANQVSSISKDFNDLGVEYSSGHGDYAEWLPRANPDEQISIGDIIAVKGGKITKDLINAEQIMAVSHRPIVLGNIPPKGEEHLGNNIAFMGQIPVKVLGPVSSGDYIVASKDLPGYGLAYSEENMTIDLLKFAVGRSWDTNLKDGPKMVNTVIGVSSGDYIKFINRLESELKSTNDSVKRLESKVDLLAKHLSIPAGE